MPKIITKTDIARAIYNKVGYSRAFAEEMTESVLSIIKDNLKEGRDVKIYRFGNFVVNAKKPRKGRNPQTGEDIIIPKHKILKFQISKTLKDIFKGKK